jgi:transposase
VISREGSVELRRALIDLGIGCAMAHRANRIAFALVRDQTSYDPRRWS